MSFNVFNEPNDMDEFVCIIQCCNDILRNRITDSVVNVARRFRCKLSREKTGTGLGGFQIFSAEHVFFYPQSLGQCKK